MKYYLDCGFNLLVYGVGSKRGIINTFMKRQLVMTNPVLLVQGY